MESPVRALYDRWIAHELAADLGFKVRAPEVIPVITVVAVSQMQAIGSRFPEGGEEVRVSLAGKEQAGR
ncbi:hypothetical protein D3C86_2129130 [compost metagenome]